ncbi:D-glycero-beta-D-manno-heptose-7-phosphate kinase [Mucilaginibacter psychrotolerans]|uniref:D-glycero-beta-D-manno-heptose-7-phosphate kinase n=1 Tax=Mucilaginibacter psychrotolerans TaxID=1524096 RepID=A0A4Y8SAD9_9SPHI|nr:D-glycero-beta-D-manno-heptose-7-phosphate kinase [Mucilaginibacter psychrotolerans]TFF35517.1 D-glycero-beta-D-manno-heptose-7-phosphate kinase [Mucilaginibacter psychrotolerans]
MKYKIDTAINVLVIGDLMIDHYIYGNCNRISPEAPVPVVEIIREQHLLGGAGNVLKNLIAFGCLADIAAVVGEDDNAAIVLSELAASNISGKGIFKDAERCTIIKSRVLVANHQLIRLDKEITKPISYQKEQKVLAYLKEHIKNHHIVLISDYDKGLLTPTLLHGIFTLCREYGIQTIVDPKGADFAKYKGANTIKPNRKEAVAASGINIKDYDSLGLACAKIQEITGCDSVIITMSEDGIAIYDAQGLQIIPTKALDVIDVTGAGDTVLASLGVAIASGNSLYDACNFANHAAAVVVSKVGSATATLPEVEHKFEN